MYLIIIIYKKNGDATAHEFRNVLLIKSSISDSNLTMKNLSEIYWVDKMYGDTFPLTYRMIYKYHHKYKKYWIK